MELSSITVLCHYSECQNAECHIILISMLIVIKLNVVMLSVVAPYNEALSHSKLERLSFNASFQQLSSSSEGANRCLCRMFQNIFYSSKKFSITGSRRDYSKDIVI